MATSNTYLCVQTVYLVLIVIVSRSPSSVAKCICTTQPSSDFETTAVTSAQIDIANGKEVPPAVNITSILTPPTSVPQKLTVTLRKTIKMTDPVKSSDKVAANEVAPVKIDVPLDGETGKEYSDRQDSKESVQDNFVFPKEEEPVTPTSAVPKKTMPVGNRILIGGMPNDGYGRDANGEIVEIFE